MSKTTEKQQMTDAIDETFGQPVISGHERSGDKAKTEPTGEVANLLDRMRTVIDDREALAKDDKVLKKTKGEIEAQLILLSNRLGTDIFRSPRLTATIKSATRYVVDTARWDDLFKWAVKNDCMHILYKQASGAAFEEMVKAGDGVPDMVTMEDYDKVGYKRTG